MALSLPVFSPGVWGTEPRARRENTRQNRSHVSSMLKILRSDWLEEGGVINTWPFHSLPRLLSFPPPLLFLSFILSSRRRPQLPARYRRPTPFSTHRSTSDPAAPTSAAYHNLTGSRRVQ